MKSRKSNAEMPTTTIKARAYDAAGIEPSIAEVLAEPIVHAVMRRDSINQTMLLDFIERARRQLEQRAA